MATTLPPSVRAALGGVESTQEAILLNRLKLMRVPPYETQVMLIEDRNFRWDVAWPAYKICAELQGGQWKKGKDGKVGGRHNRAAGYEQDCLKNSLAQIQGWIVITCTPGQVQSGVGGFLILEALKARGWRIGE